MELAVQAAHEAVAAGRNVDVALEREEDSLPLQRGWGDQVFMETRIKATAVGPPRSAAGTGGGKGSGT